MLTWHWPQLSFQDCIHDSTWIFTEWTPRTCRMLDNDKGHPIAWPTCRAAYFILRDLEIQRLLAMRKASCRGWATSQEHRSSKLILFRLQRPNYWLTGPCGLDIQAMLSCDAMFVTNDQCQRGPFDNYIT